MALSGAAWDLGDALGEIEWVRPELAAHGVAVDLGPAPLDDAGVVSRRAGRGAAPRCRRRSTGCCTSTPRHRHRHRHWHGTGTVEGFDTAELCALARVVTLLGRAHAAVAGEPL